MPVAGTSSSAGPGIIMEHHWHERPVIGPYYTLSEADLSLVRQRRGHGNKVGFAAHLSLLRYPGFVLTEETRVPEAFIAWIAGQIDVRPGAWLGAGGNGETRRQHSRELRAFLGRIHLDLTTIETWWRRSLRFL